MSKHASHGHGREGENSGSDTDPGTPEREAVFRQEKPGAEDALNEAAGAETDPEKAENGPGAAQEADSSPERKIADLEARLARSGAELAESRDQYLRKAADFENFRKRMNREKQDAIDFANQTLLLDLIPVLDDFDRALESAKITVEQGEGSAGERGSRAEEAGALSKDLKSFYEGFAMIARRLSSTLETKWGLKSYVSAGEPFDPNRHEALMMEKSAEVTEQMVQQDLLKGYTLKDRVIRSAKVKVLVPDPAAASGSGRDAAPSCGSGVSEGSGAGEAPKADFDRQSEIK
jgi:molecular chaperone GrpE